MSALHDAYERLTRHQAFAGSHISLDRDSRGEEYVAVAADWIDGTGLRFICDLARELELALALTKDGLRLDLHTGDLVQAVQRVKDTLADEEGTRP